MSTATETKQLTLEEQGFELAGRIGVDAGLCWIGDPSYILHADKIPSSLGTDWMDFCESLPCETDVAQSFDFDVGHEGLGVLTSTGCGDGMYPVYIKKVTDPLWGKRIAEVRVVFIEEEDEA